VQGQVASQGGVGSPRPAHPGDIGMGAHAMRIERYGNTRYWAVRDSDGLLICLCVYKRGALEVLRRLQAREKEGA
jgi:hypothetical protein